VILDGVRRRSRGPATDNADTIDVIDTGTNQVVHRVKTTAPDGLLWGRSPVGSSPNSLALSPDERTLYVTNAGSNSVAVVQLDGEGRGRVTGLIPTGWYPNSVSVSGDGRHIFVANGKSNAGAKRPDVLHRERLHPVVARGPGVARFPSSGHSCSSRRGGATT
jgi:YVTN family beta-propeller protein